MLYKVMLMNKRSWSVALLFCFFLLMTGCASVATMQQELAQSTNVTATFSDMTYAPINAAASQTIVVNGESPTFNFESGKSHYAAFALSEPGLPRKLNVKTHYSGLYLPSMSVFVPRFIFLDAAKHVAGEVKRYRLDRDSSFLGGGYFTGNVVVPANTAYVVLYTDDVDEPSLEAYGEGGRAFYVAHAPAGTFTLALSQPYPANHDFSTVLVKDSANIYSSSQADMFYIASIDGVDVDNSFIQTKRLNAGAGLRMNPYVADREMDVKASKLQIVGRTVYAAPIQSLLNPVYEVKGDIEFNPEKGRTYIITGQLSEEYSGVWIEEEGSGKIVGKKIEVQGSAKLGVLQK